MRKNMKRILALGLTGVLTAGLLTGSVEYAGHTFAVDAMAASVSSEKVKTNESGGLDKDEVSKQETVYVNTDAAGSVKDVVVSDWLKNSGINGSVKDVSDLTDIENVKGDEKFEQNGDKLTWNTGDQDIYYQGKTDKDLPVSMTITYKLDGKETAPKDLIGKSGKLEMTIKYTNHSKQTVSLAGKQTELYTPFMMVTGMILSSDNFSNVTIDNIRRNISSFFSWLEEEDYILKSPMRRIHKIKTKTVVKNTISDESIEKLRDHCTEIRDLAIIDLLYSTGIRVGELVNLNIDDIDLEGRECIVYGKGDKERRVYFDAKAKVHLKEYIEGRKDENKALFVTLDAPYDRLKISGVEIRLRQLGRKLDLEKIHPHKFRRTMATRAIDKGMPIEQVQKILGHSQIDTTMQYAMVNQNNVKTSHQKYMS